MGNINASIAYFRDVVTEEVACKAGLLLTDNEALTILKKQEHSDAWLFEHPRNSGTRVRPEDVESIILSLRYGVGNLPDGPMGMDRRIIMTKKLLKEGLDPTPLYNAFKEVVGSGKYKVIGEEAMKEILQISAFPPAIVYEFLMSVHEQMDLSVNWFNVSERDVTWAVPLNDLFQTEHVPDDPDVYLDQRYIDYLFRNSEDLHKIQWRNFERLTAEFFQRRNYEIELGPGTKDGGIDVRVWPGKSDKDGPPLLIIQCKRYTEGNDVHVETVKAFWSDVVYENAQHGIIATTSRVSPEGIKLSRARAWPLGFVHNKQVQHWINTMWRHSPLRNDKRTT